MVDQRRKFYFDKTINIGNVIAVIAILFTMVSYGNKVITYLHDMTTKTNIMWKDYTKSHPEAIQYLENR